MPVRRAWIDKPDGSKRPLGIPTVLDRLIQQAVAQVLTPLFDPHFSESSYGFRPGRSAHDAVQERTGLMAKSSRNRTPPAASPTIAEALVLIAKLGGYLARKSDGPPGTLALWRGWKRLTDLTERWCLANQL